MNIVFFGTPEFAIPSLDILNKSNHRILAVVTAPDKKRGRGRSLSFTPVKQYAIDNNISVLTPNKLSDDKFKEDLQKLNADLFVIVAFKILPRSIFTIPKYGSFNLHGSLLPKYRGAAPIQWAIINGDKKTGLTTFFLEDKVDTGNIILTTEIDIGEDDNLGSMHDKMSELGAELVLKTVDLISNGNVKTSQQANSLSSKAPKITNDTRVINWDYPVEKIHNLIRGLSPYPCAFFNLNNKMYKVYKSKISATNSLEAGEIRQTKNQIFIGTGSNDLEVLEIQPEGRKRMTAAEFLRGYSLINE